MEPGVKGSGGGRVFARVSPSCEPLLSKPLQQRQQQQMRLRLKKPTPLSQFLPQH